MTGGGINSTRVGPGPPRPTHNYTPGSSTSTLGTIYNVALMFPVEFTLFGGIYIKTTTFFQVTYEKFCTQLCIISYRKTGSTQETYLGAWLSGGHRDRQQSSWAKSCGPSLR